MAITHSAGAIKNRVAEIMFREKGMRLSLKRSRDEKSSTASRYFKNKTGS